MFSFHEEIQKYTPHLIDLLNPKAVRAAEKMLSMKKDQLDNDIFTLIEDLNNNNLELIANLYIDPRATQILAYHLAENIPESKQYFGKLLKMDAKTTKAAKHIHKTTETSIMEPESVLTMLYILNAQFNLPQKEFGEYATVFTIPTTACPTFTNNNIEYEEHLNNITHIAFQKQQQLMKTLLFQANLQPVKEQNIIVFNPKQQ